MTTSTQSAGFITPAGLLTHWQGHRSLTRRVIEAFPDDRLFGHSIGSMRPFGEIAQELLAMGEPMVRGAVTGEWDSYRTAEADAKEDILRLWDDSTRAIDELWPQIPAERFHETLTAFGQYTDALHNLILYVVDNEIHHRGQGYVYLRSLGIEPPPFWER
jgi:uncharacterized damage-inducible protein DinB